MSTNTAHILGNENVPHLTSTKDVKPVHTTQARTDRSALTSIHSNRNSQQQSHGNSQQPAVYTHRLHHHHTTIPSPFVTHNRDITGLGPHTGSRLGAQVTAQALHAAAVKDNAGKADENRENGAYFAEERSISPERGEKRGRTVSEITTRPFVKRQATETSRELQERPSGGMSVMTGETKEPSTAEANEQEDHQAAQAGADNYTWEDLDAEDADDPLMVSEYVNEIFGYLHELELKTLPDPNYLQWQRNMRPKMRSILVDWMVEVHLKFRLLPETLYLSINIMDRFMSRETVEVDRLQLLATGSLFIAAKYEEVYSPSVKNYAYVTDGGFTEDEILQAERFILEILDFDMSYPNPMNFLRRISKADDYDVQARTIGKYLLEITAVDYKFIGYLPSLCAAAAMYIARKMLGKFDWNGNLIHYSGGYRESDMREICEMLMDYLVGPIVHEEFFKKYASRRFMKVSILARQWAKRVTHAGKDIMDPVI